MLSRSAVASVLACSALLPAAGALAGGGVESMDTVRVASGLTLPVFATHAPDDYTRLFIVEQRSGSTGRIKILNIKTGVVNATPFLEIPSLTTGSEQGLLGLAFHPDYQNNGRFFVNYTNNIGWTVISEYTVSADPDVANPTGNPILTITQPFSNHNGGWIGFGPNDGYLYIGTGDGGSFCDPAERAQNLDLLLGKMLRIDVDGDDFPADDGRDFAIPADNPFVGITGADEIWAYGLRNPWRSSFDRATGDLYMGDVGQDAREEIDYQPAGSNGGENYGWDCKEGFSCASIFPSNCSLIDTCSCTDPTLVDPIHDVAQTGGICSITGGYVYRGCDIPTADGLYFFGDYCAATLWTFDAVTADNLVDRTAELAPGGGLAVSWVSSFGEDARGELYICDLFGGEVFKIVPTVPTILPADFDCDGDVDVSDLLFLLEGWGDCDGCLQDINGDGFVTTTELLQLLAEWG